MKWKTNWKIILQLSLFGLVMAFGTVSLIPQKVEPVFWLVIFIFCAIVIAKVCTSNYFLHGFLVSMVNSVWITFVHAIFLTTYLAHHPGMEKLPELVPTHPRYNMMIWGPVFGIMFGLILGLFALIAGKISQKRKAS